MAAQYVKDQPAGFKNQFSKIAIVGATGTAGKPIVEALLKNPQFTITALTRAGSTAQIPDGLQVAKVDYSDPSTIAAALEGHDVLIITMAATAPPEIQLALIDGAIAAGVRWILPNEYGAEYPGESGKDVFLGPAATKVQRYIQDKSAGKTSWIGVACGFWYEFSLVGGWERFGFDLDKKEVTLFGEGEVALSTSTWDQLGRGVHSLLSRKIYKEDADDKDVVVADWKDKYTHFASFTISQKEMLESLKKARPEWDWKVTKIPPQEYYAQGMEQLQKGDRIGFSKMLYSRLFYPDAAGNAEKWHGLDNEKLGLSEEDLDAATEKALEMYEAGVFAKSYYKKD